MEKSGKEIGRGGISKGKRSKKDMGTGNEVRGEEQRMRKNGGDRKMRDRKLGKRES